MRMLPGLFMLVLSLGVIAVAIQGAFRGWLPNGSRGFKRCEGVSRARSPVGFWIVFCLYVAFGLYTAGYAVRLLGGHAAP